MDLFLHGTGHCSDNDPVDPRQIHFTGIIEQRLKRHMIILRSDVFAQRIQPPKLGSSCHRDSEPGILQVCMDIQQVRPLGKEDRLMLWLLT